MLALFVKWPKLFQTQFIGLADRLICLDGEDVYLRNIFKLYERLYIQMLSEKHKASKSQLGLNSFICRWPYLDQVHVETPSRHICS
jgi:hypothetical protein